MKHRKMTCLAIVIGLFCCGRPAWSGELMVAAGAGYKRPLAKVYRAFEDQTGITLSPVFGNMRQVLSQVARSGRVGVAIGDQSFLDGSELFEPVTPLGHGRLVMIYNKYPIKGYQELSLKQIVYVAMPDPQKAIYGRAAAQFLERSGMLEKISRKMIVTATVPQVSSFVIAGSAEAGFVNITDAIAMQESIGGWLEIPQDLYDPIVIGMAVTKGWADKPEVTAFIRFMKEDAGARKILAQYGL
jgi:molybdate transport system substrate-binding protein